jgi:multiple sugar transport system permease protein
VGAEHTRGVQLWFVGVNVLVPIALALLAQRYIIRGLTPGALKG